MKSFFQWIRRVLCPPRADSADFENDVREALFDLAKRQELNALSEITAATEQRTRTLEHVLISMDERFKVLESLLSIVEERTRTLEYVARQSLFANNHEIDFLLRSYTEMAPMFLDLGSKSSFNPTVVLELKTDFPIAFDSNDHINPDSTTEGVVRPTFFVQDCINILGREIKCLDLGTGAAGIVFEFAMSGVLAVGLDGSDFCRKNRVGYWPLLPNNLFTCDITKSFQFISPQDQSGIRFDLVTMWEVLEHISEPELTGLFQNITEHLGESGYFIGSISLVEYVDSNGIPYHVTLQPREWWQEKFRNNGLEMLDKHPFNEILFSRGNGPRYQDFHNYKSNPEEGFLFVAQKRAPAQDETSRAEK
jgi:hypothetical protein